MSEKELSLPAPAKVNLFLRVTGRRADGYHEIETLFQFLDFADLMHFAVTDAPTIRRVDRHKFKLPDDDLTVRAARLLQTTTGAGRGVTITLNKNIPPGSGLGGGSSNAATTLLALNHLWRLNLTRDRLADLALQLGADVPVFIRGRAALATGVGEVLTPRDPAERWLCLCLPPVAVSTARVFAELDGDGHGDDSDGHIDGGDGHGDTDDGHGDDGDGVGDDGDGVGDDAGDGVIGDDGVGDDDGVGHDGNDLEPTVTRLYPAIAAALAHLRRHADARLTGSGAAVFAAFNTRAAAEQTAAALPAPAVVTHTRNRHPLANFGADI